MLQSKNSCLQTPQIIKSAPGAKPGSPGPGPIELPIMGVVALFDCGRDNGVDR